MQLLLLVGSGLIAVVSLTATWLAGRHRTRLVGFTVALCALVLIVPYNLATGQYGFLASNAAYAAIYARNVAVARRERVDVLSPPASRPVG